MMDDNQIGSLWQPMPLLEKWMLMPVRFIFINYITASLFYVYYPSNIFQHTRKMFMYRLLFMVCQWSLKWFCEQKKHFPSIATLFILNQILNTEFSILDVRFENWVVSFEVYSCIFLSFSKGIFCHVMGLDQLPTSK